MNSSRKSGNNPDKEEEIVFPSNKIGVEEQFLPSKGSTFVENHEVRAAVAGKLFIDKSRYRAKVFPFNKDNVIPSRYDTVIGHVIRVSRSSVRISVGYINNRPISPTLSAIMHISDASKDYVKNLDDYFVAGDIIKAKINDAKTYPLQLECKSHGMGVIYSTCVKCGEEIEKIKRNQLKCPDCGYEQSRATTLEYGKTAFIPEY